jgi:hypothetical protein
VFRATNDSNDLGDHFHRRWTYLSSPIFETQRATIRITFENHRHDE